MNNINPIFIKGIRRYIPNLIVIPISKPASVPPIKLITDKIEIKNNGAAINIIV